MSTKMTRRRMLRNASLAGLGLILSGRQASGQNRSANDKLNIAFAAPLTEIMLLGCLAQRAGKKIEWDAANMEAKNWPEGDAFIKREYRKGWEV